MAFPEMFPLRQSHLSPQRGRKDKDRENLLRGAKKRKRRKQGWDHENFGSSFEFIAPRLLPLTLSAEMLMLVIPVLFKDSFANTPYYHSAVIFHVI